VLLLILDSLGGTELLVILVVALVVFGPRKLPQLSRSLGRSLADFKRASQDFKETWEKEARFADDLKQDSISQAMLPQEENRTISATVGRGSPFSSTGGVETTGDEAAHAAATAHVAATAHAAATASDALNASTVQPPSIRPVPADSSLVQNSSGGVPRADAEQPHPATEQSRKQDWL
jgi:TatA/E family protein of Tat protein translocase